MDLFCNPEELDDEIAKFDANEKISSAIAKYQVAFSKKSAVFLLPLLDFRLQKLQINHPL